MAINNDLIKQVRQRKYLGRDFDGLRAILLEYVRTYYPDKLRDFSEMSVGGLLLDLAAYVGDNLSFYLDHQFNELSYETAVETTNIERLLRTSGVPIAGAAPATVPVTFYIEVPAVETSDAILPDENSLLVVQARSVVTSDSGVDFILVEDVDFTKKRSDGTYMADIRAGERVGDTLQTCVMALSGLCVSGEEVTETFTIGDTFVPFRRIALSNANVTEIISVTDDYGNTYYEVGALTHDVVYKNVVNLAHDNEKVPESIRVIPAPYRFTKSVDLATRTTVLTFGGGSAESLEDDIIPDPSEFALSLPYTKTFSRVPLNPEKMLQSKTLGVATVNTNLTVTYRTGGGLDHNVSENTIQTIKTLNAFFPKNPSVAVATNVRATMEVNNTVKARGGDDAPTTDDLRQQIPAMKNSQERIVTKQDLLSRVYTIPSNFGRVFRASATPNPTNSLATQLHIVSRDSDNHLIMSSDTLKENLKTYLNSYKLISEAIDILDAMIINLTMSFEVVIDQQLNRHIVLQNILTKLRSTLDIKNFHINMPIVISDIMSAIYATSGVLSVDKLQFKNVIGNVDNRSYSNNTFNVQNNTRQGLLFPPPGGIFEFKYFDYDVVGRSIT